MSYAMEHPIAIRAQQSERATFIRRTYGHLAGAILAFTAIEFVIFGVLLPTVESRMELFQTLASIRYSWLLVVGAFMGVAWLANAWAQSNVSRGLQYAGLGLYVLAEALIFVPLLCIATSLVDKTVVPTAGIMTLALFGGLTASVFITGKDFSFLGRFLWIGGWIAFGLVIAASLIGGFTLGLWFSFAMVALASGYIIYDTSNVLHRYRTDQYVASALALFASVALLFYYILMILVQTSSRR